MDMKNRSCDEMGKVAEAGRRLGCPREVGGAGGREKAAYAPLRSAAAGLQERAGARHGAYRAPACRQKPLTTQDEALVAAASEADRQAEHADVAHRGVG
jgi:hypothetical protein